MALYFPMLRIMIISCCLLLLAITFKDLLVGVDAVNDEEDNRKGEAEVDHHYRRASGSSSNRVHDDGHSGISSVAIMMEEGEIDDDDQHHQSLNPVKKARLRIEHRSGGNSNRSRSDEALPTTDSDEEELHKARLARWRNMAPKIVAKVMEKGDIDDDKPLLTNPAKKARLRIEDLSGGNRNRSRSRTTRDEEKRRRASNRNRSSGSSSSKVGGKRKYVDYGRGDEKKLKKDDHDDDEPLNPDEKVVRESKIENLRVDKRTMIEINLKIVEADTVHYKSWLLVGSDGRNYINIRAYSNNSLFDSFDPSLSNRQNFLNKNFTFTNFKVSYISKADNLGDCPLEELELRPTQHSSIKEIHYDENALQDRELKAKLNDVSSKTYFRHILRRKAVVDEKRLRPIPLSELKPKGGPIDVEARIVRVEPIQKFTRKRIDNKFEEHFLYISLIGDDEKTKARVTAYGFLAHFLDEILPDNDQLDQYPLKIKLQYLLFDEIYLKKNIIEEKYGEMKLFFKNKSLISLSKYVPKMLANLVGRKGVCQMNIRLISVGPKEVARIVKSHLGAIMVTDGVHKCQLIFPFGMQFVDGQEFTLKSATVFWDYGMLALFIDSLSETKNIYRHKSKQLTGTYDLEEMDYPPSKRNLVQFRSSNNSSPSSSSSATNQPQMKSYEDWLVDQLDKE